MPHKPRQLTPGQLLIWLGHQQHPDVPIYNMVSIFHLDGPVDVEGLAHAIKNVVEQSDALRSTFVEEAGEVISRVTPAADFATSIERVDLRSVPVTERERAYEKWLTERRRINFDLSVSAIDNAIVTLADDQHVWYLNQHHLISDAWSTWLIFQRVEAAYLSPDTIGPEYPEFGDFVENLYSDRGAGSSEDAREFWEERSKRGLDHFSYFGSELDGKSTALERVSFDLRPDQLRDLDRLLERADIRSINKDLTVFQVFATALLALLYRASGSTRIAIGAPSMNRRGRKLQETLGLLMEIFSLEVDFDEDETFLTLYEKVRAESLGFLRHSAPGASNARLLRRSGVLLNYVHGYFEEFAGMPVTVEFVDAGEAEPHVALRVQVRDLANDGNLGIDLDFNTAAFGRHMRDVAVQQFALVLEAFLADPGRRLSTIDLLPRKEREYVIDQLNETAAEYPQTTLHDLFQSWARAQPGAVAVIDEHETVTYGDLDLRSVAIARELVASGVMPGDVVAIATPPRVDFIVGVLGILMAGGAYLPIDTSLPIRRQQDLVRRARPKALVGATGRSELADIEVISTRIDIGGSVLASREGKEVNSGVGPDEPAYVLFTSGSTGEPKGVVCTHRGAINMLHDMQKRSPLESGSSHSLWTNTAFDVSVYEIFSALCFGGTLHIVPEELKPDVEGLFRWLAARRISGAYLPPFMLEDFLELQRTEDEKLVLERLLVGVEPIPLQTLVNLREATPGLDIINGYGPTETAICATLFSVDGKNGGGGRTPIGRPVQNNRLYVLDSFGQPVPFGAPGELFVAGHGVSKGYLGDDEMTEQRYLPDPFSNTPGSTMYRTGDRVRYLPDGNLQFMGRVDNQVKIRGHRVEPAEVEAAFLEHPNVTEAVVVARQTFRAKTLAAYVSIDPGTPAPSFAEWVEFLRLSLPEYMIPSSVVNVDGFPTTPNGKLDRAALPEPADRDQRTELKRPRSDVEVALAAIWAAVLDVPEVGVDEHFVELGGDSIQALQVAAKANQEGLHISTKDLFARPTIESLAEHVVPAAAKSAGERPVKETTALVGKGVSLEELEDVLSEFGEG